MAIKAGSAFVELVLDDKPYKQKLSETLISTEATAKGIDTSWRTLGAKNDATYDAMRRSYENSLTLIKNSTTSTQQDIIRAEEAKNAKIQSLNEQQFGKHTSFIDSLKKHWVAASAAVVASWMLVNKAWNIAETAANYYEQMQLLDSMVRGYKTTAQTLTDEIQKVGNGMISMSVAASTAMAGIAKGLTPEQLIKLAGAAVTLSDVMGVTVNVAFKMLAEALETGKVKSLKLAVGVIDLQDRYGTAAEKMSEYQKQQALFNMFMEKAADIQARQGDQVKSTADKMETMRVTVENLSLQLGTVFLRVAAGVAGAFYSISEASMATSAAIWKIWAALKNVSALMSWGEVSKKHSEAAREAAQNASHDWKVSLDYATKAQNSFSAMTATTAELTKATGAQNAAINTGTDNMREQEAARKEWEGWAKRGINEVAKAEDKYWGEFRVKYEAGYALIKGNKEREVFLNQWAASESSRILRTIEGEKALILAKSNEAISLARDKATEEAILSNYKNLEDQMKAEAEFADKKVKIRKEAIAAQNKIHQEAIAAQNKSEEDFILANYKRLEDAAQADQKYHEELEKNAHKRWEMERKISEDIAKFTKNEYALKKEMLDKEYSDYKKLNVDKNILDRWYAIKEQELMEQKILRSDNFFAGMRVAYEQNLQAQRSWGERGAEIFNSVFGPGGAVASSFQNLFVDIFKGQMKTAADYFNAFKDVVLGAIAKMIAEWIAFQTMLAAGQALGFTITGGGAGGGLGNLILGTTASTAASSAAGGAGGGGGAGTAGTGLIGLAQQAYTYLSGGGVAAAASTGAGIGSGATGGVSMAAAEASAAGAGATATTAGAGAAAGSLAGVGLMGAALAAYIMIGQKYFGSGPSWMNIFKGYPSTMEAKLGLSTAAGMALSQAGWYWPGTRAGTGFDWGSVDYMAIPAFAEMIKPLRDPYLDTQNLLSEFRRTTGMDPDVGTEDQRAGAYLGWLGSQPKYKDILEQLAPLMAKIPPEELERNLGAIREAGGGATGMVINEPIVGIGQWSRGRYTFGEGGFPEAVIPLGDGNTVKIKGGSNGGVSIDKIQIFLDGKEIGGLMKVVADGVVVARNRSGIQSTTRVYS